MRLITASLWVGLLAATAPAQTDLKDTDARGEPLPADLEVILRNARHLSSLVDDVLDLSQIEAEKMPLILCDPTRSREAQAGAKYPELLLFYFHYCRYIFIASARPGTLPSTLQGVWNPLLDAPWNSDFHLDVNLQENYWFAETLNLSECHEPFFDLTEGLLKRGRRTARSLGCRGFVASASTDAWFWTTPPGSSPWGMWIMGAAWNVQHFMEHYRFTLDREFLGDLRSTVEDLLFGGLQSVEAGRAGDRRAAPRHRGDAWRIPWAGDGHRGATRAKSQ